MRQVRLKAICEKFVKESKDISNTQPINTIKVSKEQADDAKFVMRYLESVN